MFYNLAQYFVTLAMFTFYHPERSRRATKFKGAALPHFDSAQCDKANGGKLFNVTRLLW